MQSANTMRQGGAMRGNFVLLRAGSLRLLLPQEQVGAASFIDDANRTGCAVLSQRMTLLADCPADRFVAAPLEGVGDGVMWAWDELRVLIGVELTELPVPATLCDAATPVRGYVELEDGPAFVCDAGRIAAFAGLQEVTHAA